MNSNYRKELINQMNLLQDAKNQNTSKLEAFKKEILILRHYNFSYKKISNWLNQTHNMRASLSHIHYMTTSIWKNDPFLETIKSLPDYE